MIWSSGDVTNLLLFLICVLLLTQINLIRRGRQ